MFHLWGLNIIGEHIMLQGAALMCPRECIKTYSRCPQSWLAGKPLHNEQWNGTIIQLNAGFSAMFMYDDERVYYTRYIYIYNYIIVYWRHEHSSTCETMLPCYRPCYLGALCCIDLVGWCLTRGILLAMGPGPSVIAGSQNTLWQIC